MDGLLLVLALIGWVVSQLRKKDKKKSNRRVAGIKKENLVRQKAPIDAEKRFTESEKRMVLTGKENNIGNFTGIHEGESSAAFERMEEAFRGSMQDESAEGECICPPELEHVRTQVPDAQSVYSNEIGKKEIFDFSPRGLVQGFVMGEILNRPARYVRQR